MPNRMQDARLVWITRVYAVNPDNIAVVFHGHGGHVEITFLGGLMKTLREEDLTEEGRALLVPPAGHAASHPGSHPVIPPPPVGSA